MHIFPSHLFNPQTVRAGIVPNVISGGTALSGDETVIQTDGGGRWRIEYSGIDIDDPEMERLWDQWVSYLRGGSRVVLVPLLSLATAPRPQAGAADADPSDLLWDDDAFPTFVRFASTYIIASTTTPAILRAPALTINVARGARIRGGEKFSVGNRGHLIERVTARSGQQATCIISPPLREPIVAGTAVNFDWPLVQCRAEIGQSLIPEMEMGMYSTVAISFIEDFSDVE